MKEEASPSPSLLLSSLSSSPSSSGELSTASTAVVPELPDFVMGRIVSYLPKLSVVMFAIAKTAPPSSFRKRGWDVVLPPTAIGIMKAVVDNKPWETLDFDAVPNCGGNEVGAVLTCIDGKSCVVHLKLTFCLDTSNGSGLGALRTSTVLKTISTDPTKRWRAYDALTPDDRFMKDGVLDVVNDILRIPGNSFMRLQIPGNNFAVKLTPLLRSHEGSVICVDSCCAYFNVLTHYAIDENTLTDAARYVLDD